MTDKGEQEMARRRTELVRADADTDLLAPQEGGMEIFDGAEIVEGPVGGPAERPEDVLAQPPDARDISAELAAPPRRKLPWLTLVLAASVVAAGAFAGGALVEKSHLQSTSTGARGGAFAGGARPGGAAGGAAGGRGGVGTTAGAAPGGTAASGTTVGTIKLVDGSTIYVTDAQGNIVKVTTAKSTAVTEAKSGKVADLQPGQSVTVRGAANSNGDITATSVAQGAAPTGGFGGFGGGFGGGGGAGAAPGGTGGGN
jgi:hypothetical protein